MDETELQTQALTTYYQSFLDYKELRSIGLSKSLSYKLSSYAGCPNKDVFGKEAVELLKDELSEMENYDKNDKKGKK